MLFVWLKKNNIFLRFCMCIFENDKKAENIKKKKKALKMTS